MKATRLVLLAATLICMSGAAWAAGPAKSKLYKWVDKDGITHYGSSIPPEYATQASQQLNAQGEVVKTTEAQKTPEQLAADAKAKALADQQAAAIDAQKKHDKVLLDTYTSVADMERTRDSRLSGIDAQIIVLNGSINGVENTLADYQGRANDLTKSNKPVPADLQKRIDGTQQQLLVNQQQLLQQQQARQQVSNQFGADIERFKELKGLTPAPGAATH